MYLRDIKKTFFTDYYFMSSRHLSQELRIAAPAGVIDGLACWWAGGGQLVAD